MMLKQFFDISTGFRFSKLQWGSVPSIPVAVLELPDGFRQWSDNHQAIIRQLSGSCQIVINLFISQNFQSCLSESEQKIDTLRSTLKVDKYYHRHLCRLFGTGKQIIVSLNSLGMWAEFFSYIVISLNFSDR